MAKQPPKEEFLGGFTFNEAGARPAEPDAATDDTGPIRVPTRITPQGVRTTIIVIVVLLLIAVLYVVSDYGLGGVSKSTGHPNAAGGGPIGPSGPPKNF
jgi:hypothetical protein